MPLCVTSWRSMVLVLVQGRRRWGVARAQGRSRGSRPLLLVAAQLAAGAVLQAVVPVVWVTAH